MSTGTQFGQLTIEPQAGGFLLRGPEASGDRVTVACDPVAISNHVRIDDEGGYRPLSGARTMPPGWATFCARQPDLDRALDAIYPLARTHQARWRAGTLRVVPLDDVLSRQTGRYASAFELSDQGRRIAAEALCGGCVRTPVWGAESLKGGGIPCPEACSVLVALCSEAVAAEREQSDSFAP